LQEERRKYDPITAKKIDDYIEKLNMNPIKLMMKYKNMINKHEIDILLKVNKEESKDLYNSWKSPEFNEIKKKFTKKPKF
jgi:hypothetical protein